MAAESGHERNRGQIAAVGEWGGRTASYPRVPDTVSDLFGFLSGVGLFFLFGGIDLRRKGRWGLLGGGVVVWPGEWDSLKRFKDDVREVKEAF